MASGSLFFHNGLDVFLEEDGAGQPDEDMEQGDERRPSGPKGFASGGQEGVGRTGEMSWINAE